MDALRGLDLDNALVQSVGRGDGGGVRRVRSARSGARRHGLDDRCALRRAAVRARKPAPPGRAHHRGPERARREPAEIFFVAIGGFDTHNNRIDRQSPLLAQVSASLSSFHAATVQLGVASQVTTFTLSDFGRTLAPASGGGSDHAWGNHHLVLGGAVQGRQTYGTFPTLALGGPDDFTAQGRWIPTSSTDQYAATLARWFGVAPGDLSSVLPNVGRFATDDLGFLG